LNGLLRPWNIQRRKHTPNGITAKMAKAAARSSVAPADKSLVDVCRRVLFLENELQTVGPRLSETNNLILVRGMPTRFGPLRS